MIRTSIAFLIPAPIDVAPEALILFTSVTRYCRSVSEVTGVSGAATLAVPLKVTTAIDVALGDQFRM